MDKRTIQQNKSLHKGFDLLATALNDGGLDMQAVFKVKAVSVPWSPASIKECLYRPIMVAMYDKHSTTEIDTQEISHVWDVLMRHMGEHFNINLPFPSNEEAMLCQSE